MNQQSRFTIRLEDRQQKAHFVHRFEGAESFLEEDFIALESSLDVEIDGRLAATLDCSPGKEKALALGHAMTNGWIRSLEVVDSLEIKQNQKGMLARLALTSPADFTTEKHRFFARDERRLACSARVIHACREALETSQNLFRSTGASHAVGLFSKEGASLAFAEDICRSSAMDKAVGDALLNHRLQDAAICFTSSRANRRIVEKAIGAGVMILACAGTTTNRAIELAESVGLTLAGFVREGKIVVYSGLNRMTV